MDPALWHRAAYLTSAHRPDQIPLADRPEIAIAGRSNSGKSTLLNRVANRRNLARTSGQPGRTQALNYYTLGDSLYLVDLPGYGFAKAPKGAQARWQRTLSVYFGQQRHRLGLILTVDIRRLPGELDDQLLDLAASVEIPVLMALTKADKLRHGARQKALAAAREAVVTRPSVGVILFSAQSGQGVDAVRDAIAAWVEDGGY